MSKTNSPYRASFTAAGLMYAETNAVVRALLEEDTAEMRKRIKEDIQYLKIQSITARARVSLELVKRFEAMPATFWSRYLTLSEREQRFALFFVLLKTYKLLFHFQVNVALPKYNSVDRVLVLNDVLIALNDIASTDEFVDCWTEKTRKKISSSYLTMLKQAGLIDEETKELMPPTLENESLAPYIKSGDVWFLQACFVPQYRIEQIKEIAK